MTNKKQCEAVVIHGSLQEMIRQKQICSHDVHHLTFNFFLIENVQIAYLSNIGMYNRRMWQRAHN